MYQPKKQHFDEAWISKLNETTVATLYVKDTSWKVWTTVSRRREDYGVSTQSEYQFKFIIKHQSGARRNATWNFDTGAERYVKRCSSYSIFSNAEEYTLITIQDNDYQFIISASAELHDRTTCDISDRDCSYILSIGDKKIGVLGEMWPISEKLVKLINEKDDKATDMFSTHSRTLHLEKQKLMMAEHLRQLQSFNPYPYPYPIKKVPAGCILYGVDHNDVTTLLDNPELRGVAITAGKCQSYAEIEQRYGIRHLSKKLGEMIDIDFWSNTDKMEGKVMCNEERATVIKPEMVITKKLRLPSLPNKFTINAFDMKLDVYFYIQEYNGTSYLSIGVISDKPTDNEYWSSMISLNIQLHHKHNHEFNRSADISRAFNNYQRSAGCPTFMLSNELGDYCQRDGSYIVTIRLSPTIITNDIQYPGIKDAMIISGNKKIMVSRDLLLHYCGHYKTLPPTDNLSDVLFPFDRLTLLLDLIYHRSKALTFTNVQKLLNISVTIMCQYTHNYCDRLLASHYHKNLLSVNRTKEFMDIWDLPQLREAEKLASYIEPEKKENKYLQRRIYPSELPSFVRVVKVIRLEMILEVILPKELVGNEKEKKIVFGKLYTPFGRSTLKKYRTALSTMEGVPQRLRDELRYVVAEAKPMDKVYQLIRKLEKVYQGMDKGDQQRLLIASAVEELKCDGETTAIDRILARSEEDGEKGRKAAGELFWRWMLDETSDSPSTKKDDTNLRSWMEYVVDNDNFIHQLV